MRYPFQLLFFSVLLLLVFFFPSITHAAIFTVATTTDTTDANAGNGTCADSNGECSLRAAIQEANALAGNDTINFGITVLGGGSVATITPATDLPTVTASTTIDGSTQSGSSCGDLWGGSAPTWKVAIQGSGSLNYGLKITSGTTTIKGLQIQGYTSTNPMSGMGSGYGSPGIWSRTLGNNNFECNNITGNAIGLAIQDTASSTVGGVTAGKGNLIKSNSSYGIFLFEGARNNLIAGNFIGTNAAGTAAAANADGIKLNEATTTGNTIGGLTSGARNLISGSTNLGIALAQAATTTIQGNYIGTNAAGTGAIPNVAGGMEDSGGSGTVVGGTETGARNVFSGNTGDTLSYGIAMNGILGVVQGNYIGINAAGTGALPNVTGVVISSTGSANNTIGGTTAAERNIISGNTYGALLGRSTSGNALKGNYIGTAPDGTTAIGNSYGILLIYGAANHTVGGTASGAGNIIANSTNAGVTFIDPSIGVGDGSTGNAVLGNAIYANGGRGIVLTSSTPASTIDTNDADTGPNNLQNYPVITAATTDGSTTSVTGTLNSLAAATYRIEFFANATADGSGYGEGTTYLGSTSVTTSANNASFTVTGLTGTTVGYVVTATASQDLGSSNYSTSEFSLAFTVTAPAAETPATTSTSVTNGSPFIFSGGNPFSSGSINIILPTPSSSTPLVISVTPITPPSPPSPSVEALRTQLAQLQQQLQSLLTQSPQTPPITIRFPRNLRYGDTGEDVYQLQLFLIEQETGKQATYLKDHGATRYYGLLTTRAVAEFQRAHKLPGSGYFGPRTREVVEGM